MAQEDERAHRRCAWRHVDSGGDGLAWWRGLPGGSSLAQLLAERRGVRNEKRLPRLTEAQILGWADAHRQLTGKWPDHNSGPVNGTPGETWRGINTALVKGGRGLPRGLSLALLLKKHRGRRHRKRLPRLTHKQILRWADAHRHRWGKWPTSESGPIQDVSGETWNAIEVALRRGHRGLPGGSSLAKILARHRGTRNKKRLPKLTCRQILAWADAHHEQTGRSPHTYSGRVLDAPGETWLGVDKALRSGWRGLRGRSSLFRLLRKHRKIVRWSMASRDIRCQPTKR